MKCLEYTDLELRGRHGVYKIENTSNGRFYVGSSVDLFSRKDRHHKDLLSNTHHSTYLQRAWSKHGDSAFVFSVLEFVGDKYKLIEREQYYINSLRPVYNMSPTAGSNLGIKFSKAARQNMSKSKKGRPLSDKNKEGVSKALKGRVFSEETRALLRCAAINMSEETKRKISRSASKRLVSQETRQKISAAGKGKSHSEETKQKIGLGRKGRLHSEESKEKMSKAKRGVVPSDETREKQRKAQAMVWTDEKRKEMSEKIKLIKSQKKLQQL